MSQTALSAIEVGPPTIDADVVDTPPIDADGGSPPRRLSGPWWTWPALGVMAVLAGLAYGWDANSVGIELYYAGAVRTMSTSWHAFFFAGLDPAGSVTLDKLPGSFWVQALTVRAFGVHTWCFVAPQIAAGVLTVIMVFIAVRRIVGARTGLVAAGITLAMPAMAVLSRGNTADPIAILLMVVAADATLRAMRNGRLRTLVIAGLWVGLAFQAKMIEAWAILPALFVAYVVAAPGSLGLRFRRLGVAAAVTVVVSLSWMTVVSLVPAGDRPYVDGSTNDSVYAQVFEYNGLHRFDADSGYGLATHLTYRPSEESVIYTHQVYADTHAAASLSRPGPWRLVRGPIGRDTGWLLPAALACMVALLVARRRQPRTDLVRAGALLWGGWLVTFTIIFSLTAELPSYYIGVLVPPIAALCAIGLRTVYRSLRKRRSPAAVLGSGLSLTIALASTVELAWGAPHGFRDATLGLGAIAIAGFVIAAAYPSDIRRFGIVASTVALVIVPGITVGAFVRDRGASFDAPLSPAGTLAKPASIAIRGAQVPTYGGVITRRTDAALWASLSSEKAYFSRVVKPGQRLLIFSSAEAGAFILAGVPNVEVLGGFTGWINAPTVAQLQSQINNGEIAYAIVPGAGSELSNDPRIQLIESTCNGGSQVVSMAAQLYVCGSAF